MAKKYLLYIHDDEWFDAVENKSELVNRLLDEHRKLPPLRDKPLAADTSVGKSGKTPAAISEKCKGMHYMDRTDCGKLNCPWGTM